jgi:hypothetical protein
MVGCGVGPGIAGPQDHVQRLPGAIAAVQPAPKRVEPIALLVGRRRGQAHRSAPAGLTAHQSSAAPTSLQTPWPSATTSNRGRMLVACTGRVTSWWVVATSDNRILPGPEVPCYPAPACSAPTRNSSARETSRAGGRPPMAGTEFPAAPGSRRWVASVTTQGTEIGQPALLRPATHRLRGHVEELGDLRCPEVSRLGWRWHRALRSCRVSPIWGTTLRPSEANTIQGST